MTGFGHKRAGLFSSGVATVACACLLAVAAFGLTACSQQAKPSSSADSTTSQKSEATVDGNKTPTSASTFHATFQTAVFDAAAAVNDGVNFIDVSHVSDGYIGAAATNSSRLKLQIICGDASYNYDLPGNGSPLIVPVNMGNGSYTIRVMQNTSANRYIEVFATTANVTLVGETSPFVRPNTFCNYTASSACVVKANELCAGASSTGDAFDRIYNYVAKSITYDYDKADTWASATGYTPDPDETLASGKGICFDYASLTAAMLRSQGIPCKIVTGYVSPDNIYHAWDMVYIDGTWVSIHISAPTGTWARADMTFVANGAGNSIGNGTDYTDRYTY